MADVLHIFDTSGPMPVYLGHHIDPSDTAERVTQRRDVVGVVAPALPVGTPIEAVRMISGTEVRVDPTVADRLGRMRGRSGALAAQAAPTFVDALVRVVVDLAGVLTDEQRGALPAETTSILARFESEMDPLLDVQDSEDLDAAINLRLKREGL